MMRGLSDQERRDLVLSVGTHRGERRLSPLEVAQLLLKTIEHGSSRRDCSAALGIGTSQIGTFLKLLDLTPEVQHLAGWGNTSQASVPFSSLAELRRLSATEQVLTAEAILSEALTWKEVIEIAQIADRSGQSVSECVQDVVGRRTRIETRHVFVGKVAANAYSWLDPLGQDERDALLGCAVTGLVGCDFSFESRLGTKTFTVVASEDILHPLGMNADQFEAAVNMRIQEVNRPGELPD